MTALTAEEAAIYDRQLRVWGVEAQQRMRSSKVLVLGCRGAAIEVRPLLPLSFPFRSPSLPQGNLDHQLPRYDRL